MKEGNPMSNEANERHIADDPSLWWKQAVVYQVYPRSFKDTTGSGLGDIAGVAQQIPYLKRLGVDAIWLSPFYPSQLADGGYDVDDYRNVDPKLGTMDDFDHLTKTAHAAGIKIVVDIVPNHSSNQHEWFKAALAAGPGSPERDRYIFRDGKGPNGDEPPTNWIASFGGSAWTRVPDGQWYLHMFTVEQPDWNWKNPDVRADFIKTLHFWLDHGADGFRVDVAHGLAKDLDRDDLDDFKIIGGEMHCADGTHPLYDRNEVHDIYREWRKVFNEYNPPAFAVAEAWVPRSINTGMPRPKNSAKCSTSNFAKKDWIRNDMHLAIEEGIAAAERSGSTSTWVMSNHDIPRHVSRYGLPQVPAAAHHQLAKDWLLRNGTSYHEDRELGTKRARAAILMELALPGSAYIYQGEELGLPEVADIPWDELEDPTAFNRVRDQIEKGRDGCRVPLPWKAGTPTFGFSPATKHEGAGVDASQAGDPCEKPHLPQPQWFADYAVDREDTDSGSMLNLYRKALGLRHEWMTADTTLTWLDCDRSSGKPDGAEGHTGGIIAFRRANGWASVTNFGAEPAELPAGDILLVSGPLTDDGRLPQDTTAWIALGLTGPHQPQFAFNNQDKGAHHEPQHHTNRRHRGDARHGNIAGGLRRQQRRFQQGPRVFHEQQGRGRGPVQGTGQHVHQEDRRAGGHPDRSRRHIRCHHEV